MKNHLYKITFFFLMAMMLWSPSALAQTIDKTALIGAWEIEGTLMGNDGTGWVLPHKHAAPDCGKDHSIFMEDLTAKEVTYAKNCTPVENEFQWRIEGNTMTLTRGDKTILWHVLSIEEDRLKVGVQLRPESENRMYVVYKKRK